MYHNKMRLRTYSCQILFLVQVVSFLISFVGTRTSSALDQLVYFIAVLPTPILVICFGYRYFQEERFRLSAFFPLCAELFFFIVYFGSLIYGIQEYSMMLAGQQLFQRLLIVFLADILISSFGFIIYRLHRRHARSFASQSQSAISD